MLPIRLGMLNARGPQDLIAYILTRNGRVETSNSRSVKIPSEAEVPLFVKDEFKDFYKAMFATTWKKEGENVAILEHFWDMAWCDPCAAQPLSQDELRGLGVFWVGEPGAPQPGRGKGVIAPQPQAQTALLTRLHVRYDAAHFPEDLVFQETRDRQNFQGRYILRHAFTGSLACPEAEAYVNMVRERREQQVTTTARLTGWGADEVRRKLEREALPAVAAPSPSPTPDAWWKGIWK